jgi:hypothetical protein
MIPSGVPQLLILAAFVMPGFIFQATRLRFRGQLPGERDQFSRVLRALGISFFFDLFYFAVFSRAIQATASNPEVIFERPVSAAVIAFNFVFLVPIIAALLDLGLSLRSDKRLQQAGFWKATFSAFGTLFTLAAYRLYNSAPSSWDFAARRLRPAWIRIQYTDNVWMGGYLGATGFINATPEPRELYLEQAWQLSDTGEFERPIDGSLGVWVNCTNAIAVEYIVAASKNEGTREDNDGFEELAERGGRGLDQSGGKIKEAQ